MWRVRRFLHRLRAFLRPGASERELARELTAHLGLLEDEYRRRGLRPDEARLAARRSLGGVDQLKELHRDARSIPWLEDARRDVPHAFRSLGRNPGFAFAAVATLAIGIGANTTMFSVVNSVLLKPLSYARDSDRLVRLMMDMPAEDSPTRAPLRTAVGLSAGEIAELQRRTRALSHVGTVGPVLMGLGGHEEAARLQGARVSASVFPMLGARPLLGRVFDSADERTGGGHVVLLSHSAWQRHFAGDHAIVGRTIRLESVLGPRRQSHYTVVGVMPGEFRFPTSTTQFWLPFQLAGTGPVMRGPMLGRLADGVSIEAAAAEVAPAVRQLRGHPARIRYQLVREQAELVAPVRPALLVLWAAVAVVLLIACVNVANLLLARSAARQREFAIRAALGAGRMRLIRQALAESLVLALLGGTAGVLLAVAGVRLLRTLATTLERMDLGSAVSFPRLDDLGLDGVALVFALGVSVAAGVLFGLAPAVGRPAGRASASLRASRLGTGRLLVIAEVAMATVLLVVGTLLVRSFVKLSGVGLGYDPQQVLTFQVAVPVERYPDERLKAFAEAVVAGLRAVPGVQAAAYANQLPMVVLKDTFRVGRTPDSRAAANPGGADARFVSRDYFRAMGIRVRAGRGFDEAGEPRDARALLINQALARREFGRESPLGATVFVGRDPHPWRVIGVVDDVRQFGFDREPEPQFFAELRRWAPEAGPLFPLGAYYAVRTTSDPWGVVPHIRQVVRGLDDRAALFNVAPMQQLVSTTLSRPRMYAVLAGVFAGVAVLLAAIGLYGVIAYTVARRTREIGIRMALGAHGTQVMRAILGRSLATSLAGLVLGLAGAAAGARVLESMLFGLRPLDPATYVGVSLAFAAVATLASYLPARRVMKVDPVAVLRCE